MVKLAICHPFLYTRGGAERVVLKIAQHFKAKIYCSIYDAENTFEEFKELDVEQMPAGAMRFVPSLLPKRVRDAAIAGEQFFNLKIQSDYDVVNLQGTPSEWARNKNKPAVWFCHTPNREAFDLYEWRMRKRNVLEKALYASAIRAYRHFEFKTVPNIEFIFANSRNTQERIKKFLGLESEVLNPGVEFGEFSKGKYGDYFFYPSRIAPEKRFELAIEAFRKFKEKWKGRKMRFVIAGALVRSRADHVAYFERIKKMLGEDGEILLDVDSKKLNELYAGCRAVVYTPINEDFGIIPLEAGASFKPCIAVNEGGPKEVIVQGETGYLVNSTDEMAVRMAELAESKVKCAELGGNAGKRVKEKFSWDAFLTRFEQVCEQVAKEKK
ncbi:glycosyltransferase [Candidatus Micrarchaeota archaeon]|nr:glycosyltransferase [Candidatus Micrarchaeota archaeon]